MFSLPLSRQSALQDQLSAPYMQELEAKLAYMRSEWSDSVDIYPPAEQVFAAYELTPLEQVRVVILGQDPYHGPWQAHGLAFSVPDGVKIPPSLRNIFKEMAGNSSSPSLEERGLGGEVHEATNSWDLTYLASQWVLLLNSILTVSAHEAWSHRGMGREQFTDATIQAVSDHRSWVIFLLRGAFAQSKRSLIDISKHTILKSSHPSPLSAYRWFTGCGHFAKTNEILREQGKEAIRRLRE